MDWSQMLQLWNGPYYDNFYESILYQDQLESLKINPAHTRSTKIHQDQPGSTKM